MLANIGDFLFRFRNLLFPLCLPLAFLPGPRLLDDALVAAALGFAASAVGELVRASTIGLQYIVRGGRDRRPPGGSWHLAGNRGILPVGNLQRIAICAGPR